VIYSAIIFYVSSWQRIAVPLSNFDFDKLIHVFEYMPFGFLLARGYTHTININNKTTIFISVAFVTLIYGMSDEVHQFFVPGRDASVFDVVADSVGGILGCWIYQKFYSKPK